MSEAADGQPLVALLELEEFDIDLYGAPSPAYTYRPNIFGGQVAAQALRAASLTVPPDKRVHSLHSYFLRSGRPGDSVVLYVERVRDGKSFATRRVVANQHGEAIFILSASFHVEEPGVSRELPMSDVPGPEDVPPPSPGALHLDTAFDVRSLHPSGGIVTPASGPPLAPAPELSAWYRLRGNIGDDASLHASVLAYMSDMRAGMGALVEGQRVERIMMASLDHAMWFHRPIRADDWVFMEIRPISTAGSRGLSLGTIHDRQGVHGVTFIQELLVRERRP